MKNQVKLIAFFLVWAPFLANSQSSVYYNVKSYGAVGDGLALETKAIQRAIEACAQEGGVVLFPPGTYLTGTIYLKSNVTLRIEKSATILGSPKLEDYPVNDPDYIFFRKGILKRALIYADHQENIAIEGTGTIDGQGRYFTVPEDYKGSSYSIRPYLIWMTRCKGVRTEGVRLKNSGFWMQHYLACDDVYIHNINIFNHCNKNNDMIDIDDCHNVIISDIVGDSDDDGITLKSTSGRGCKNITITNCLLSSHCNAIKCGTESSTGFKNVVISNIVIRPSQKETAIYGRSKGISGISLEMVDGGVLDGISISNVIITGTRVPLFVRLGNRARKYYSDQPEPSIGEVKNISLSNITAYDADSFGSSFTGLPNHPVINLSMAHIRIYYSGGGTKSDALRKIPEVEKGYPEAFMFGKLNAYGMYFRHVKNLNIQDVECYTEKPDFRPALWFEDVDGGVVSNLRADVQSSVPLAIIVQSKEIFLSNLQPFSFCSALLEVAGTMSNNIRLTSSDLSKVKQPFILSDGAEKHELKLLNNFK